jgi:hypothetical protein
MKKKGEKGNGVAPEQTKKQLQVCPSQQNSCMNLDTPNPTANAQTKH